MPENSTPTSRSAARSGLDLRSPYVFDLRELGRRAGTMREYRRPAPAPAGLGTDLIGVPGGAPLELDVRLESVTEGVLVTGTVTGRLEGQCGRCLDPVAEDAVIDFVELFAYPDSATEETTEEDEVRRLEGDHLALEPVVRDVVVLALPWTPLCRPDCAGLCSECGQRLDDLPPGHAHEQFDPRWAALAALQTNGHSDAPPSAAAEETTKE